MLQSRWREMVPRTRKTFVKPSRHNISDETYTYSWREFFGLQESLKNEKSIFGVGALNIYRFAYWQLFSSHNGTTDKLKPAVLSSALFFPLRKRRKRRTNSFSCIVDFLELLIVITFCYLNAICESSSEKARSHSIFPTILKIVTN